MECNGQTQIQTILTATKCECSLCREYWSK